MSNVLVRSLILALLLMASATWAQSVDFDEPVDTDTWTLLGSAAVENDQLTITNDQLWQVGAIYLNESRPLSDPIEVEFRFSIQNGGDPADGWVFMTSPTLQLGQDGGNLGFNSLGKYGIEYDIYAGPEDPVVPHFAVMDQFSSNHLAYVYFPYTNGMWYDVHILIDDGQFVLTVDGTTILEYQHPTFDDTRVDYLAITGATGGLSAHQMIDDLTIHEAGPVRIRLHPTQTVIPPSGGVLTFDAEIQSTLPNVIPGLTVWTTVQLPNGNEVGPLLSTPFTLTPYMSYFYIGATQAVPGGAPGGTYIFRGHLGYYGTATFVADEFDFEKSGTEQDNAPGWLPGTLPVSRVNLID